MRRVLGHGCIVWTLFASCAGAPPEFDPVRDAAAATASDDAIRWLDAPEPIDAARSVNGALTAAAAVRAALQHDPRLQAVLADARAALAATIQARRWPNPVLDVALRFPSGGGATQVDAGLGADVLAIVQTPARAAAADQRARQACAAAVAVALDVVAAVQASYYRLQSLDAEAPLAAARSAAAVELASLVRARLDSGDATQLEAAEFDALRLQTQIDALEREHARAAERLSLRRLLGAPSSTEPLALAPWQVPAPVQVSEDRCIQVALRRRPELAAARAEIEALGGDLAQAGLAWLAGARFGVAAQREDLWSLGPAAALPLPVFDGGGAREQQVGAELAAARHRATAQGRAVVESVRAAVAAIAAADGRLQRVRDDLVPQQRRRRELAETAWRAGDGERGALLRAEQELRLAEAMLVFAQRDVWLARVELERAVGGAAALTGADRPEQTSEEQPR